MKDEQDGHCLVFLPGKAEISEAVDGARKFFDQVGVPTVGKQGVGKQGIASGDEKNGMVEVLQLYGQQDVEEQQRVFQAVPWRKIIFSTNVAETSVTIDGVKLVVDAGRAKENRFDAGRGVMVVEESLISQSSINCCLCVVFFL